MNLASIMRRRNLLPPLVPSIWKVIEADGSVYLKHYKKPANRGITLHFNSHHPTTTKRTIANNELQRASQHSTKDNHQESI